MTLVVVGYVGNNIFTCVVSCSVLWYAADSGKIFTWVYILLSSSVDKPGCSAASASLSPESHACAAAPAASGESGRGEAAASSRSTGWARGSVMSSPLGCGDRRARLAAGAHAPSPTPQGSSARGESPSQLNWSCLQRQRQTKQVTESQSPS